MTFITTKVLLLAATAWVGLSTFNFVSIGDWGCVPIGGYQEQDELVVARTFQQAAEEVSARFVLNTGDNFYYCGVPSKDDAIWNTTYEAIFNQPSMMVPWYSCLGNHDYGYPGSATAQMQYVSPNSNRWILPDRYYYKRLEFPGEVNISLLVLDATPCQKDYVSDDPAGWDPCGSVIPSCPGCTFHQNVIKQSCSAQLTWLKQILPTIPSDDWKIVMVHAPAGDVNVEDLITPLQDAHFDLYINGHVHLLAHYTMDNAGVYITTGAACMVRIPSEAEAKKVVMPPVQYTYSSCPSKSTNGHSCQIVFEQTIAGYTTHSFNEDFTTLSTFIYDYDGHLLHTAVSTKGGHGSSGSNPGPGPGPSPASSSTGGSSSSAAASSSSSSSCCMSDSATCHAGEQCCTESGKPYTESDCASYGAKHDCKWKNSKCTVA